MGRHQFQCPKCQNSFEALRIEGNSCPQCGFEKPTWQPSVMVPNFKSFWHPHLGHDPVYIDSAKKLDSELAKRDLHVPMPKKGRKGREHLPQSEKEARHV